MSFSREARIGRSGDADRERRVASLLATSGVDCTVKVCRETRRARRQRRAQAEPQPDYLPIGLRENGNWWSNLESFLIIHEYYLNIQ